MYRLIFGSRNSRIQLLKSSKRQIKNLAANIPSEEVVAGAEEAVMQRGDLRQLD